jgi:predicted metal-dependent hydrolase
MDYEFTPDIPKHWADDNPVLTAFMSALSATFPPGERFFIESVRHYAERVTDPALKERIRGFIGQEANHTKEHIAFNAFLATRGYPVAQIEKRVERILRRIAKRSSPASNLAQTAALEHLTAFLASAVLEEPQVIERTHPTVAAFWTWHAIEEVEHRSVAFDVYKQFVDDEFLRLRTMALITFFFSVANTARTVAILSDRGELLNGKAWFQAVDTLFGREGLLRKAMPLYRAYYRRDFHPDQHEITVPLERAKQKYLGAQSA